VIPLVHIEQLIYLCEKQVSFPISIEGFELRVLHYWAVSVEAVVPPEPIEVTIVIIHGIGEDLCGIIHMLREWLPDKLHGLVLKPLLLVLVVQTGKEPGVEAHVCEEARVGRGVTEGVHMPADAGSDSKLLLKELVPDHHVVNHILVVRAGLVMHAPPAIHDFQAPLLNQLPYLIFHVISLLLPPHAKEFHLNVGELLVGISE